MRSTALSRRAVSAAPTLSAGTSDSVGDVRCAVDPVGDVLHGCLSVRGPVSVVSQSVGTGSVSAVSGRFPVSVRSRSRVPAGPGCAARGCAAAGVVGPVERPPGQRDGRAADRLGRERDRLACRTICRRVRSVSPSGEQVEHDLGAEPGGADAEPGVPDAVGDPAADRGAPEGAEPRAGVDRTAPRVREPQALELREGLEEVLGEHRAGGSSRLSCGPDPAAVVVDRVEAAPQDAAVGGRPGVVELVVAVADPPRNAQPMLSHCSAVSGSVISA